MKKLTTEKMENVTGGDTVYQLLAQGVCGALFVAWLYFDDVKGIEAMTINAGCS